MVIYSKEDQYLKLQYEFKGRLDSVLSPPLPKIMKHSTKFLYGFLSRLGERSGSEVHTLPSYRLSEEWRRGSRIMKCISVDTSND